MPKLRICRSDITFFILLLYEEKRSFLHTLSVTVNFYNKINIDFEKQ
jgi:hypothetical protein